MDQGIGEGGVHDSRHVHKLFATKQSLKPQPDRYESSEGLSSSSSMSINSLNKN